MRLDAAIVLPAVTRADEARRRLAALPGRARIVVRLEWDGQTRLYAFRAGEVLAALTDDEVNLAEALGLLELQPTGAVELDEEPTGAVELDEGRPEGRALRVLVHGDDVLGVLVPERRTMSRSPEAPLPSYSTPEAPVSPGGAGDVQKNSGLSGGARRHPWEPEPRDWSSPAPSPPRRLPFPFPLPRLPWRTRSVPSQAPAPPAPMPRAPVPPMSAPQAPAPPASAPPVWDVPRSAPAPDDVVFAGFPRVGAPEAVVSGTPFDVRVGVVPHGDEGEAPMTITRAHALADASVRFIVSVMGHGFDFPDGVRAELLVPPGAPEPMPEVVLEAVAQPVTTDVVRVLEVSFECEGDVVGRAWREVLVCPEAVPQTPPRARSGGTGIQPPPGVTPHLTIEIRSRQGEPEVEWLLHSRDALATPEGRVTTVLDGGSAREFAIQIMNQVPPQEHTLQLSPTMIGIGKRVAAAMPPALWPLLEETWRRARDAGEVPTLLILTNEPWVPWELAWVDGDYVDPTLLPRPRDPNDDRGACLGSLWRVGRWVPPIARTPRGGDRPPSPPTSRIDLADVAVVIGDYASDVNLRPLPEAEAEGAELTARYDGLALKATEEDVDRLLRNRLTRDGHAAAPNVVHIAAHGEVSPDNQQYSGIILSGSQRRLDPLVIQGSELTRETRPFVFLNACQVGTAGMFLSDYGGMPGAFLSEGCRGFVAPLWNVDDEVAHEFARSFYDAVIDRGAPVAESLRQLRLGFGSPWANGTATPLAYVFYGHPSLVLARDDDAPAREGGSDGGP